MPGGHYLNFIVTRNAAKNNGFIVVL
jgi:hypothetical protein